MKKLFLILLCAYGLNLCGFSQTNPIPNAGFEHWHFMGWYENPDGWQTNNNQLMETVVKDTVAYSGKYAMKVKSNGYARVVFPVGSMSKLICGIYVFTWFYSEKPDTAKAGIFAYNHGILIDSGLIKFTLSDNQYNKQILFFDHFKPWGVDKDTIEIIISGGKEAETFLRIDSMKLDYFVSIKPELTVEHSWNVITEGHLLKFIAKKQIDSDYSLSVYSLLGHQIYSTKMAQQELSVPMNQGIYFYRITSKNLIVQSGKVMVP